MLHVNLPFGSFGAWAASNRASGPNLHQNSAALSVQLGRPFAALTTIGAVTSTEGFRPLLATGYTFAMLKKDVKVGAAVRFFYEGEEHTGIVEKIDYPDVEQVLVGDIVPAIAHEPRLMYQARQLRPARE
jgi:hypothetical protein